MGWFTAGFRIPAEVVGQMRTQSMWPAFEVVAHTLVYDATIMGDAQRGNPLPPDLIAGVTMPTLVIVGSESPAWARNSAQALADDLRDGQLRMLEGEFHAVAPTLLAPALQEFFGGSGTSGGS